MSDAESRILPWPGGPRPPGAWGRPPTGPWPPGPLPPGPGPFPQPPDVFSAFAWLAKNYREAQAAKEFLKLLLQDLIAEDPAFLANAQATVGVTDGSAAQPGMVGERLEFQMQTNYSGAQGQTALLNAGVLPPGDWDLWWFAGPSAPLADVEIMLDPVPKGISVNPTAGGPGEWQIVSPVVFLSSSSPQLLALEIVFNASAAGPGPGTLTVWVMARRRR